MSAKEQSVWAKALLLSACLALCSALASAQQTNENGPVPDPQASVTLSTPEPASTPDAPSALRFGESQSAKLQEHRITASDKFHVFLDTSISPETFAASAAEASLMDDWKSGLFSTSPGYWTRYRTALATNESRALFSKYLLPVAFHQDPRYHRMEEGGMFKRGLYAATRVLITRSDDGGSAVNTSHIVGALASRTLANTYIPYHDRTVGHTLQSTGSVLLSDAGRNLLREFGPDLKAKFFSTRLGAKFARVAQRVRTVGVKQESLQ